MRESKIDVVASEQQMIAHGDTLDVRKATPGFAEILEETEIGGPPADVDDDDVRGAGFRNFH